MVLKFPIVTFILYVLMGYFVFQCHLDHLFFCDSTDCNNPLDTAIKGSGTVIKISAPLTLSLGCSLQGYQICAPFA